MNIGELATEAISASSSMGLGGHEEMMMLFNRSQEDKSIDGIMTELADMAASSLVYPALQFGLSKLQYSKMIIFYDILFPNTPVQNEIIDKHVVPLMSGINYNYRVYGMCPIKKKKMKVGEEYYDVPVVYPKRTWRPRYVWNNTKKIKELIVRDILTGEIIPIVVHSTRCSGLRPDNSWFDTDCGALLNAYRRYVKQMQIHDEICRRTLEQDIIIQRAIHATTQQLDEEQQRLKSLYIQFQMRANGSDKEIDKLESKKSGRFITVPESYQTTSAGSSLQMHVDMKLETDTINSMIAACLRVPITILSGGTQSGHSGMGHRNEKELDLERHHLSSAFEDISTDERQACMQILELFYGKKANVIMSVRAFTHKDDIEHMVSTNALDREHANELLLEMSGIRPEYSEYREQVEAAQAMVDKAVDEGNRLKRKMNGSDSDDDDEKKKKKKKRKKEKESDDGKEEEGKKEEEEGGKKEEGEEEGKKKKKKKREADSDDSSDDSDESGDSDDSDDSDKEEKKKKKKKKKRPTVEISSNYVRNLTKRRRLWG